MLTIERNSKKQFWVRSTTNNGRILASSETFTMKANAIKNIKAQLKMFGGKGVKVLDNTFKGYAEVLYITPVFVKKISKIEVPTKKKK